MPFFFSFLIPLERLRLTPVSPQVCKDGAWVENKGALLTFHYRETPPEVRPYMIEKARSLIVKYGFKPVEANCAVEAKPPVSWNKGKPWGRVHIR